MKAEAGIVGRTFHDLRGTTKLDAMVAALAAPANDATIGAARPQRQANGFTGSELAAKRVAEDIARWRKRACKKPV